MQKTFSRSSLVLALAAVCGFGAVCGSFAHISAAPSAAAPSAVAVVNVRQVMRTIKEYAALGEMQKASAQTAEKQRDAKQAELKGLQETARTLLTPGSEESQKAMAQIEEKTMQYETWFNYQKKQLARQEAAILLGLYKKVCNRAQKLADEKMFDILLAENLTNEQLKEVRLEEADRIVNGDREVLWARKSSDLTADLIAAMDNEFAQRGAPAPAPAVSPLLPAPAPAAAAPAK